MYNCSSENASSHIFVPERAVTGALYALFIALPNGVVFVLICHSVWEKRQDSIPRVLMGGLCGTDLGFGVLTVLPQAVKYWIGDCAMGGVKACFYLGYTDTFFLKASHVIVVLMSLERATALSLPFQYPKIWTMKSALVSLALVFVYANVIAVLPLLGVSRYGYRSFCWFQWDDSTTAGRVYAFYFVIEGLILTTIMAACNVVVIRELLRMRHKGTNSAVKPEFIVLMIAVSVIFIICTTPVLIRILCLQTGVGLSAYADFVAMRFFITNSAINCHMYWVLRVVVGRKLFSRIRDVVCRKFRRQSSTVKPADPGTTQDDTLAVFSKHTETSLQ